MTQACIRQPSNSSTISKTKHGRNAESPSSKTDHGHHQRAESWEKCSPRWKTSKSSNPPSPSDPASNRQTFHVSKH